MKAMILAAGMGTRLKPLTDNKPKALVEIKGIPLVEIVIKRLIHFGFTDIIINLHHFGDMLRDFISGKKNYGINISYSDEKDMLLDTGGGIFNAKWFFDNNPFLVYNVDILTDMDISKLVEFHVKHKPLVTLAVSNRETSRKLLFDSENQLCQWVNLSTGQKKVSRQAVGTTRLLAYSGMHIIDPAIFELIEERGAFSIMDVYLKLASDNAILGFEHEKSIWYDLGKYQTVVEFNEKCNLEFLA